jgi:hypothetical protein
VSPLSRGIVIALVQVLLVAGVGGKLLYDRVRLPRVWAPTTGIDPVLPIRGRYVSLWLVVEADLPGEPAAQEQVMDAYPARLVVVDGSLRAVVTVPSAGAAIDWTGPMVRPVSTPAGKVWALTEPIAFFLPEEAPDPTQLASGDTLWAEVTIPPRGAPRPIRLEVRPRG